MKTKTNFKRIIMNSIRLYFAPITGAYRAVLSEAERISNEQHKDSNDGVKHV
jgi:hypothetical protein